MSDNATMAVGCKPGASNPSGPEGGNCGCPSGSCLETARATTRGNFTVSGYYMGPGASAEGPDSHPIAPGRYTVVAADEWGQIVTKHFTVTNPGCQVVQKASPFPEVQSRYYGRLYTPGAWTYEPTSITETNTYPPGLVASENVAILSSALQAGQSYTIVVAPYLSDQHNDSLQSDLAITVGFLAC
jgi:hypothetical protein